MKFLADMGISPGTIAFLRSLGHDAIHLNEQGLDRMPDSEILEKARHEHRVLLTHDLDFGELVAASGYRLPSVIIFRLRNMRPENVNRYLKHIIGEKRVMLAEGAFVSVTEGQIRVRLLPFQAHS
jgi:predicted nuclease of predicted toxin-antitoxin system